MHNYPEEADFWRERLSWRMAKIKSANNQQQQKEDIELWQH